MAIGGSIQQIKETTEGAWLTNIEVKPSHTRKRSTVRVVYINQGIAKKGTNILVGKAEKLHSLVAEGPLGLLMGFNSCHITRETYIWSTKLSSKKSCTDTTMQMQNHAEKVL